MFCITEHGQLADFNQSSPCSIDFELLLQHFFLFGQDMRMWLYVVSCLYS